MGENEFNCPEYHDCNILSYESKEKAITIKDNVFFGANHLDGGGIDVGMEGNVIYLFEDQYLYMRHWDRPRTTILSNDNNAIEQYKQITKDKSSVIVLKRGSWKAKKKAREIKRKVNWKPVIFKLDRVIK